MKYFIANLCVALIQSVNWINNAADLNPAQKRLTEHLGNDLIFNAAQRTLSSCQTSMSETRWNCQMTKLSPLSRESAFVEALSTVELVNVVRENCNRGFGCLAQNLARQMALLDSRRSRLGMDMQKHCQDWAAFGSTVW